MKANAIYAVIESHNENLVVAERTFYIKQCGHYPMPTAHHIVEDWKRSMLQKGLNATENTINVMADPVQDVYSRTVLEIKALPFSEDEFNQKAAELQITPVVIDWNLKFERMQEVNADSFTAWKDGNGRYFVIAKGWEDQFITDMGGISDSPDQFSVGVSQLSADYGAFSLGSPDKEILILQSYDSFLFDAKAVRELLGEIGVEWGTWGVETYSDGDKKTYALELLKTPAWDFYGW